MEVGEKRKREEHQEISRKNNARKFICDFVSDVRPQPRFYSGAVEIGGETTNGNQTDTQEKTPTPGLALEKSLSEFNQQLELKLSKKSQKNGNQALPVSPSHRKPHAIKASNIPALFLKIGKWEWESKNEGDLVAKFYFGNKKLVWEILCGSLKKKIEFKWSHISAMNAFLDGNQTSRLEIKLKDRPKLCEETKFNPKKRTQWEDSMNDFTGDQTRICNHHTIKFAQRVLDGPLAMLLERDARLFNLTRQPFPHQNPPLYQHQILDFARNIIVPNNAPNLVQPVRTFVGQSSGNLPTPVLKDPSLCQNSNMSQLTLTGELDNILPNHELDSELLALLNEPQLPNLLETNMLNDAEFNIGGNGVNNIGFGVDDDELFISSLWD